MFFDPQSSFEIRKTFDLAIKFLRRMSDHSPHAKQYHCILQEIAALIQQRHDHISQQRRQSNRRYTDRVLVADDTHGDEGGKGHEQGIDDATGTVSAEFEDFSFLDETAADFLPGWDHVDIPTLGSLLEPFLANQDGSYGHYSVVS